MAHKSRPTKLISVASKCCPLWWRQHSSSPSEVAHEQALASCRSKSGSDLWIFSFFPLSLSLSLCRPASADSQVGQLSGTKSRTMFLSNSLMCVRLSRSQASKKGVLSLSRSRLLPIINHRSLAVAAAQRRDSGVASWAWPLLRRLCHLGAQLRRSREENWPVVSATASGLLLEGNERE